MLLCLHSPPSGLPSKENPSAGTSSQPLCSCFHHANEKQDQFYFACKDICQQLIRRSYKCNLDDTKFIQCFSFREKNTLLHDISYTLTRKLVYVCGSIPHSLVPCFTVLMYIQVEGDISPLGILICISEVQFIMWLTHSSLLMKVLDDKRF